MADEGLHCLEDILCTSTQARGAHEVHAAGFDVWQTVDAEMGNVLAGKVVVSQELLVQARIHLREAEARRVIIAVNGGIPEVPRLDQELDEQPHVDEEAVNGCDPQSDWKLRVVNVPRKLGDHVQRVRDLPCPLPGHRIIGHYRETTPGLGLMPGQQVCLKARTGPGSPEAWFMGFPNAPVDQCHSSPEGWAVAVGVMTALMNGTGF